jgi:hypothetical protein
VLVRQEELVAALHLEPGALVDDEIEGLLGQADEVGAIDAEPRARELGLVACAC